MDKKQEFLKKILATFRIEADENLNSMTAYLIELEKNPDESRKAELIEVLYRAVHSLKGASRAVSLTEFESICHSSEDVMAALRDNEITFNKSVFDTLHNTVDLLTELLDTPDEQIPTELSNQIHQHIENLALLEIGEKIDIVKRHHTRIGPINEPEKPRKPSVQKKDDSLKVTAQPKKKKENPLKKAEVSYKPKAAKENVKNNRKYEKSGSSETIRVSTKKLDSLLFQSEEMLSIKLNAIQQTKNLQEVLAKISIWNKEASNILTSTRTAKHFLEKKETLNRLTNEEIEIGKIIQFQEWATSQLANIEKDISEMRNFAHQEAYSSGAKIEGLLEEVKELITIPFSTMLDGLPKMVRNISKDLEKDVDFSIKGDEIEIDRRILEKLKSPLIHLLRNSIDYGIEDSETRIKNGKTEKGHINIDIEQLENNKVEIRISDDGLGINTEKLKTLYIKNERISENEIENIDEKEYLNYIFKSGVSTSNIVTDLSGRGLGLAIVQETIEQLGGSIDVKTIKGKSTIFYIQLPISIITFRGILLESSGYQFIVPTAKVQKVLRLKKEKIKTIENKATISMNGEIIPLVSMSKILELPVKESDSNNIKIIVFLIKRKQIGFIIDNIIGEQEVLVKNFNKQLSRVRNISGATILGSGKVVPIINITDIFKSSLKQKNSTVISQIREDNKSEQKSVLVVEDSITSRTLLKNILEAADYKVTTAIDGIEGFTKLKEGSFNIVLSDVEMPRMNGFDLTAKIRSDKETSDMPVILITSLSKREDKERGIDVGANAYIIKSAFDQSNLLEILDQMI